MIRDFDKIVGLKKLVAIHTNDSKVDLGEHKDRHEHLGKGKIGKDTFKYLVNHPKLKNKDLILETPYDSDPDPRLEDMKLLESFR